MKETIGYGEKELSTKCVAWETWKNEDEESAFFLQSQDFLFIKINS